MFLKLPNLISRKIWAVGKIQNVERLILSIMAFSEIPNLLKLISRKIFSFFLADLHLTMASREQQRLLPATHPISDQPPRPWRPILLGLTRPPMPLRKTWWIGTAIASLLIRAYNVRASLMVGQKTSSLPYVISKRVKTYSAPNLNMPLKIDDILIFHLNWRLKMSNSKNMGLPKVSKVWNSAFKIA